MTSRAQPLVQVCLEYGLTGILPLNDVFDLRYDYIRDTILTLPLHKVFYKLELEPSVVGTAHDF